MSRHSDLPFVSTLLTSGKPEMAYRTINAIIRDALEQAGAAVNASDGMRRGGGTPRVAAPPVRTWYGSEAREANKAWQRLRFRLEGDKKRGTLGPDLEFACAAARKRYRRIRAEKICHLRRNGSVSGKTCDVITFRYGRS